MNEDEYEFSGENPMKECYEAIIRLFAIAKALEEFSKRYGDRWFCARTGDSEIEWIEGG